MNRLMAGVQGNDGIARYGRNDMRGILTDNTRCASSYQLHPPLEIVTELYISQP